MQDKSSKNEFFRYKIKLHVIQALFLLVICLISYFFYCDFSQKPSPENTIETKETTSESEPISYDKKNLQSKIAEIVNEIESDEIFHEENTGEPDEISDFEENESENTVEQEPVPDNVKVTEESFYEEDNLIPIAIVIDDMGISQQYSKQIIGINAEITTSFLTYGKNFNGLVSEAKKAGKEIIVHIPMEPYSATNTAPDQLNIAMSNEEIKKNFEAILAHFDADLVGGNNHMGSKFTENKEKMSSIMEVLQKRNMFFLDSRTSAKAIGCDVAKEFNVDCINRDVFLDNENNFEYITKQLKQTEKIAEKKGYAVAIGHPKSQTVEALKNWVEKLDKNKFKPVYLSELIKKIKK